MAKNPFKQRNDTGACKCADCGQGFTGLTGFDFHLAPEHADGSVHQYPQCKCSDWWPRCRSEEELREHGYELNSRGRWYRPGARPMAPGRVKSAVSGQGGSGGQA